MKKKKQIAIIFSVFIALLTFLWILLMLSACIPNKLIHKNMLQSALAYKEKEAFSFENGNRWNAISDNYADSILLNISWNMGKGSPFISSLDTWYYDGETLGENVGLYLSVIDEEIQPNNDYSRYWHGSAMFVRFMHLFTDVRGMKICGFAVMLVLALVTIVILLRYRHQDLAVALLLSMAAVHIWNIRLSLEYQPSFILCFLFCILYLCMERKSNFHLTLLSVAGGVAIAFFDFLTTETVVLLLPLVIVISVRASENRLGDFKNNIRLLVTCGSCWLVSYVGSFLVKWTVTSLVTVSNKYLLGLSSASKRIAGSLPIERIDYSFLRIPESVAANLTMLFGGQNRVEWGRVFVGLLVAALILGSVLYLFCKKSNPTAIKLLAILGSVVFLRYMILNNHSYLHEFFTYRALISLIMAILAGMFLSIEIPTRKKGRKK